jgi:predicted anti-sigma-YlaC factor YlaD
MDCYQTIDLMGDALENSLAPECRPEFDEHLEECAPCRVYMDQLRVTLAALERLPLTARPMADERRNALISAWRRESGRN